MTPPASAVATVGVGPDLLLIHGTATDAASWRPLARLLADRARATAYDRRGTPGWPAFPGREAETVEAHAEDAADLIRGAGRPSHVVGASLGGVVALELARRSPELVRSLALFEPGVAVGAPAAVPRAMLAEFESHWGRGRPDLAAESFHRRVLSDAAWSRLPEEARARAVALAGHIRGDLRAISAYLVSKEDLAAIRAPVLLLRGARSRPAFEAALEGLRAALPGSRVEVLEHAAHQLGGRAWPGLARALSAHMDAAGG